MPIPSPQEILNKLRLKVAPKPSRLPTPDELARKVGFSIVRQPQTNAFKPDTASPFRTSLPSGIKTSTPLAVRQNDPVTGLAIKVKRTVNKKHLFTECSGMKLSGLNPDSPEDQAKYKKLSQYVDAAVGATSFAKMPFKKPKGTPSTPGMKQAGVQGADDIARLGQEGKAIGTPLSAKQPTGISSMQGISRPAKLSEGVDPLSKTYTETAQKAINTTSKQVKESPTIVQRVVNSVKEARTKIIEYVQNSEERVRQLVARPGLKIDDVSDPYLKATLYHGKVATKINQGKEEARLIVNQMKKTGDDLGSDLGTIRKEVNDYLRFRHAPERNVALGEKAAGITTAEAQEGLRALEASPHGVKIKELANQAQKLNNETLDILKESGVITDDLYNTLRTKYKSHVPLQRIFEETDDVGSVLAGKGFDVKSTGIKRAVGSERQVDDILANIMVNHEQAILRAEKNIVDQSTLAFVRSNTDELGDLFQIMKPKAVGKTFEGQMILENTTDPTVLQMFVFAQVETHHLSETAGKLKCDTACRTPKINHAIMIRQLVNDLVDLGVFELQILFRPKKLI